MSNTDDYDVGRPQPRESYLTLSLLLLVGWLIIETTHMPGLAAVTMCLKFGWDDFRTAFWLRRNDPVRERGVACFWLYLSSGLWRMAVMAVLMLVLIVLLVVFLHQPKPMPMGMAPPPRPREESELIFGAVVTAVIAFLLSSLTTYRALWYGLSHRVRFWLSSGVHKARREDQWPPLYGRSNWAAILLTTVLLLSFLVFAPFFLMFMFGILEGAGMQLRDPLKALAFVFVYVFFAPIYILIVRDFVVRRIVADHPAVCWGTEKRPDPEYITDALHY